MEEEQAATIGGEGDIKEAEGRIRKKGGRGARTSVFMFKDTPPLAPCAAPTAPPYLGNTLTSSTFPLLLSSTLNC